MKIEFEGNSVAEIVAQMQDFLWDVCHSPDDGPVDTMAQVPVEVPVEGMLPDEAEKAEAEDIKPVLTIAQREELEANAPEHKEPPQPTLEEVRAVMKELRDRKGVDAVKALLADFGVKSVPDLKPEQYITVYDRARMEA